MALLHFLKRQLWFCVEPSLTCTEDDRSELQELN